MSTLLILVFALLGLFVGSFLNVCIDRLPYGQSIIRPRSHCATCKRTLSVLDMVPIFSYFWFRGRCRYCRALIPLRIPIVEGITGIFFALLCWKFGLGRELVISLVYTSLMIIIFFIDLENQLVLDKVVYPSMVLALAFSFFWPGIDVADYFHKVLPGEILYKPVSSFAGGASGLVLMALPFIVYRGGMGFGDVKLGALVGLIGGFPAVFITILLSWISGGVVALILLALKIKERKDPIPMATFMAISVMVTFIWGKEIWEWYWPY